LEYPNAIGIRHGALVDALLLNDTRHGGQGGENPQIFSLDEDDYWTEIEVHSGADVDYLKFKSKRGVEFSGGGGGGDPHRITGVRLLRVGGRSGAVLDNVKLEYVPNYEASTVMEAHAFAALDFQPGGIKITKYREETVQIAEAYSRITEQMIEFTMNTSAEGEYYAKFSASTGLKTVNTTKEEIKRSSESALKTSQTVEDTIAANEVGVLISAIKVMRDSSGNYWVYPTNNPNWTKLDYAKIGSLAGYYDFTSGLAAQTGLQHKIQYGLKMLTVQ
jgi:hypothetical protein